MNEKRKKSVKKISQDLRISRSAVFWKKTCEMIGNENSAAGRKNSARKL